MRIQNISDALATAGVAHEYVNASDYREAEKISVALLKDKAASKQVKVIEQELRREANKHTLTLDALREAYEKVASWFVREYGRKNPNKDVDSGTLREVINILAGDFQRDYGPTVATSAVNEGDFYTHVIFGYGRSGSDAFLSFLHALKPFMIFGLKSFKQASNGNWVARGRYIVLEIGATDPKTLLNARGCVGINYIKATTPSEDWERRFDSVLREFTDSFLKKNSERVTAALSEDDVEARDKAAKPAMSKLKQAGFAFKSTSKNNERIRIEIASPVKKTLKKIETALTGWKVTKSDSDETVFAKGDVRISVREKSGNTFLRIRHKAAKDWAARKPGASSHNGAAPVYLGKVKLPEVYHKSGLYHAVKFQARRVYYYKPVGVSDAFIMKLLDKTPVAINKYVRSGKVEIVAVFDAKTKKPFVRATTKSAKTSKKAA